MVDPRDLGLVTQVRSPHHEAPTIYLYEAVPGGVGLCRAPVRAPRRARRRGGRAHRRLRLRSRLPGLHRTAPRAGRRRQGPGPAPARRARRRRARRAPSWRPSGHDRRGRLGRRLARPAALLRRRPRRRRPGRRSVATRRAPSACDGPSSPGGPATSPSGSPRPSTARSSRGRRPARPASRSAPSTCRSTGERLAGLPGGPPPDVPLVCLDTETTGLATAAGTVAFLVGLGRWRGDAFRQVQLLLPDHADEPALLDGPGRRHPARGWLVTYNGRGFDWPLLVARYRMDRRAPPPLAGHLDLLPFVRRVFRHRLERRAAADGRGGAARGRPRSATSTAGRSPAATSTSSRGGPAARSPTSSATTSATSRSLARLLAHVDLDLGADPDAGRRPSATSPGSARVVPAARGRHDEALDCLDAGPRTPPSGRRDRVVVGAVTTRADAPTTDPLGVDRERARGRAPAPPPARAPGEALAAWRDLVAGRRPLGRDRARRGRQGPRASLGRPGRRARGRRARAGRRRPGPVPRPADADLEADLAAPPAARSPGSPGARSGRERPATAAAAADATRRGSVSRRPVAGHAGRASRLVRDGRQPGALEDERRDRGREPEIERRPGRPPTSRGATHAARSAGEEHVAGAGRVDDRRRRERRPAGASSAGRPADLDREAAPGALGERERRARAHEPAQVGEIGVVGSTSSGLSPTMSGRATIGDGDGRRRRTRSPGTMSRSRPCQPVATRPSGRDRRRPTRRAARRRPARAASRPRPATRPAGAADRSDPTAEKPVWARPVGVSRFIEDRPAASGTSMHLGARRRAAAPSSSAVAASASTPTSDGRRQARAGRWPARRTSRRRRAASRAGRRVEVAGRRRPTTTTVGRKGAPVMPTYTGRAASRATPVEPVQTGGPPGASVYFYELHEGDDDVFADLLLAHEEEMEPEEFFQTVQTRPGTGHRTPTTTIPSSRPSPRSSSATTASSTSPTTRLTAAVNVSHDADETLSSPARRRPAERDDDDDDEDDEDEPTLASSRLQGDHSSTATPTEPSRPH